ncbi:hypothetical protein [Burkholderia glumae]|uniref:hypothetical protein n=1 Tax=Burkholderia glumae TaxID=337 RepID=UPI0003A03859|nr:hypothetical protein [Burkholderia glumae]QKM47231.1 hypothetical protein B7760_01240 [Burkholderia glumae]UVS96013.1 hypothetical protein EFP19_09740 [Burkholderia glumae]
MVPAEAPGLHLLAARHRVGGLAGAPPGRLVPIHERAVDTQAPAGTTRRDAGPDRDRTPDVPCLAVPSI